VEAKIKKKTAVNFEVLSSYHFVVYAGQQNGFKTIGIIRGDDYR
jgi:hypothetical protein